MQRGTLSNTFPSVASRGGNPGWWYSFYCYNQNYMRANRTLSLDFVSRGCATYDRGCQLPILIPIPVPINRFWRQGLSPMLDSGLSVDGTLSCIQSPVKYGPGNTGISLKCAKVELVYTVVFMLGPASNVVVISSNSR